MFGCCLVVSLLVVLMLLGCMVVNSVALFCFFCMCVFLCSGLLFIACLV